jgi:hypothetical protein
MSDQDDAQTAMSDAHDVQKSLDRMKDMFGFEKLAAATLDPAHRPCRPTS